MNINFNIMTKEEIFKNSMTVRDLFVQDCYNVLPKDIRGY